MGIEPASNTFNERKGNIFGNGTEHIFEYQA